jgi:hypothetical protein
MSEIKGNYSIHDKPEGVNFGAELLKVEEE